MALNFDQIRDAVLTHAQQTGLFDVVVGAPLLSSPPLVDGGSGLSFEAYMGPIQAYAAGSGLASTAGIVVIYCIVGLRDDPGTMSEGDRDDIDPRIASACDEMLRRYGAGFTLGGLVRNIDIFGAAGQGVLGVRPGWVQVGGPEAPRRRVGTITLPMIVNDLWPQSA
jgi:hypothetical protein